MPRDDTRRRPRARGDGLRMLPTIPLRVALMAWPSDWRSRPDDCRAVVSGQDRPEDRGSGYPSPLGASRVDPDLHVFSSLHLELLCAGELQELIVGGVEHR